MADIGAFQQRFEDLLKSEDGKDRLIQDLIDNISSLSSALSAKEVQLEREKDVSNMYHQRYKDFELKLREKLQQITQTAFVSVLIDGDCMNFVDDLIKKGEDGGHEAVRLLKSAVMDYLRNANPGLPANVQATIRVYANARGLAKAYRDANIITEFLDMDLFIRGFNMEDALCDFIDAGSGKECSDEKLRARFRLHVADVHCYHLIFGASADNGYARLLGPYSSDDRFSGRITMLQGPPFARELAELAPKFSATSFPKIFRSTKLPNPKPSFSLTPPRTPAINYASVAATSALPDTKDVSTTDDENRTRSNIARNKKGQRVDRPLRYALNDVVALKGRKLCNNYHIWGYCSKGDSCLHAHGTRLSGKQLDALRHIARMSPCPNGLECYYENCTCGHRCTREPCTLGDNCWFPQEMHGVDTKIV